VFANTNPTFYNLDTDNEDSGKMLRHLELIDDEALEFGVKMVKISDPLMAKKYGHRDPPGINIIKLFSWYITSSYDKLECLSIASLSSLV
jgi:hypothetical protein